MAIHAGGTQSGRTIVLSDPVGPGTHDHQNMPPGDQPYETFWTIPKLGVGVRATLTLTLTGYAAGVTHVIVRTMSTTHDPGATPYHNNQMEKTSIASTAVTVH